MNQKIELKYFATLSFCKRNRVPQTRLYSLDFVFIKVNCAEQNVVDGINI